MSEPEAKARFKRGDVREDGKVFWGYIKKWNYEEWVTADSFERKNNRKHELQQAYQWIKCYMDAPDDRWENCSCSSETKVKRKRGEVREDGKMFWTYAKGKERWTTPEQFQRNKEALRKGGRKWDLLNREKRREKDRQRFLKNLEKERARHREYRKRNPDKAKEWAKNNPEKLRGYAEKWRTVGPGKEYDRKRRATDPLYALAKSFRSRIWFAFKRLGLAKPDRTENLLGTTIAEAKRHIETQFKTGMSWNNYGEWHIDHVIPLASAKTPEEMANLCRYTNLQPLWGKDNLSKGAKMPHELKKEKA